MKIGKWHIIYSMVTEPTLIMEYMNLRVLLYSERETSGYHGIRYYCQQDLGEYGPNSTIQLVLNLDYMVCTQYLL